MGNNHSESSGGFVSYIEGGTLLEDVENELKDINTFVCQLKTKTPYEIEDQLHMLLISTENKLNRAIKLRKSKWHMTNPFKRREVDTCKNDLKMKEENESLKQEIKDLKKKHNDEKEEFMRTHIKDIEKLENEEMKNLQLLLRINKEAGEKMITENHTISYLPDANHPTKIGEIYNEIYDNEWKDALDGLTDAGHSEEEAITTLYLTLLNVYDFCKLKAETMLAKTDDAVNYLFEEYKLLKQKNERRVTRMSLKISGTIKTPYGESFSDDIDIKERWMYKTGYKSKGHGNNVSIMEQSSDKTLKKLQEIQKEVAEIMEPVVQKAYLKASWVDKECVHELKPFIKKCIFVCWMMVVQSPQMYFHIVNLKKQNRFDEHLYKEYTISGSVIKKIIWPAMLLYENGSVVCKGIVECCKSASDLGITENVSVC